MYNLLIPDEFVDYLTANGFRPGAKENGRMELHSGAVTITIKHRSVSFWRIVEADTAPDIQNFGSVYRIDRLDLVGWQAVLHAFGIIPMRQLAPPARREPSLFEQLGAAMRPTTTTY